VQVLIPRNLLAGHEQLAGAFAEEVVAFADRPLHQLRPAVDEIAEVAHATVRRAGVHRLGIVVEHQVRDRVVHDAAALHGGRPDLDHLGPARLGERDVAHRAIPDVLMPGRHRVFGRTDHEIRRTEAVLHALPLVVGDERLGRRHVLRVALRRAGVHPLHDGVDLRVGERHVVLEVLHADALVDVPRRHLPRATRSLIARAQGRASW
jgi:hypothetical protein